MLITADMPKTTLLAYLNELGLTEWQRITVDLFPQQTGADKVVPESLSGLGCLVIVLLFFWLIVTRGCSQ